MTLTVGEIVTGTPLNSIEIQQYLCKTANKFGLYVGFDPDYFYDFKYDEIQKATNNRLIAHDEYGNTNKCVHEGQALFLFETYEEMFEAFKDIVGKDGPTNQNSYSGELRVYAMTISNEGEILTENN